MQTKLEYTARFPESVNETQKRRQSKFSASKSLSDTKHCDVMKHVIYWNKISYTKFRGLMIEKCDCQIYANFGFMSALKVHTQENRNDVKYLTNMIFFIEIWRLFCG